MNKDTKKADRVGNSVELDSLSWSNTAKFSFFFWYILPGRGCYFSMLRQECSTKNNYGGQGEKREGEGSMLIQRRRIEIKCRSSSSISRYRPTTAGVGKNWRNDLFLSHFIAEVRIKTRRRCHAPLESFPWKDVCEIAMDRKRALQKKGGGHRYLSLFSKSEWIRK